MLVKKQSGACYQRVRQTWPRITASGLPEPHSEARLQSEGLKGSGERWPNHTDQVPGVPEVPVKRMSDLRDLRQRTNPHWPGFNPQPHGLPKAKLSEPRQPRIIPQATDCLWWWSRLCCPVRWCVATATRWECLPTAGCGWRSLARVRQIMTWGDTLDRSGCRAQAEGQQSCPPAPFRRDSIGQLSTGRHHSCQLSHSNGPCPSFATVMLNFRIDAIIPRLCGPGCSPCPRRLLDTKLQSAAWSTVAGWLGDLGHRNRKGCRIKELRRQL